MPTSSKWSPRLLIGAVRARLAARLPLLADSLALAGHANVVDRAAALAMFCLFAAVPALFVAFSVIGYLLGAVEGATQLTGSELVLNNNSLARVTVWLRQALPGVSWNPADFAAAMVQHRGKHGVIGTILAISLGLTVLSRIDHAVRAIFGRRERSTLRAAGYATIMVVGVAILIILLTLFGPLLEWGAHVAASSVSALSLGWLDGVALIVAATQVLPVALLFYLQVHWSVSTVSKRRTAWMSLLFGIFWFIGQRLFSMYVQNIVKMDAVYGALTGIIALLMWLFYASMGFLFAVSLLAAWQARSLTAAASDSAAPAIEPAQSADLPTDAQAVASASPAE